MTGASEQVLGRVVGTVLVGLFSGDGLGDDRVEVDGFGGLDVAFEVDVDLRQPHGADAVGDRVVQLGEQRAAAAFETLDDREAPQRTGAVEGILIQAGAQVEELTLGAGTRERDVAQVVVEVELGVGRPGRGRQPTEAGVHPFT